jgi:hypothetical protein
MPLANIGIGREYDVTFKIGSDLATTTSQYKVVVMDVTGSVSDWTVKGVNQSATSAGANALLAANAGPIGVIQDYLTSGSTQATVRMFGVSKVFVQDSIAAGSLVQLYIATIGSTYGGMVVKYAIGQTVTASGEGVKWALGRALQNATATAQAISVFVNPTPYL